jgi:hypothetical protein
MGREGGGGKGGPMWTSQSYSVSFITKTKLHKQCKNKYGSARVIFNPAQLAIMSRQTYLGPIIR